MEVQDKVTQLKHKYEIKRSHLMNRLFDHKEKIEDYFVIFYNALDNVREKILR